MLLELLEGILVGFWCGYMKFIIVYDVSDDKVRRDIVELLLDEGAERIQYSAFIIECSRYKASRIFGALVRLIGDKGKVIMIPVCKRCWHRMIHIVEGDYDCWRKEEKFVV